MKLRAARHFFNVEKTSKKRKATSWQRTFTYLNNSHVKSGSFPTMRGYLGDATTNIHVGICWYVIYIYILYTYICVFYHKIIILSHDKDLLSKCTQLFPCDFCVFFPPSCALRAGRTRKNTSRKDVPGQNFVGFSPPENEVTNGEIEPEKRMTLSWKRRNVDKQTNKHFLGFHLGFLGESVMA